MYLFHRLSISFLTLLTGMEEKSLKLRVLEDVLKTLDCPVLPDFGDIGQKQVEKLVQEETLISLNEVSHVYMTEMEQAFCVWMKD